MTFTPEERARWQHGFVASTSRISSVLFCHQKTSTFEGTFTLEIFSVNSSTRSSSLVRVQASSIGRLTEQSSRELLPRHANEISFHRIGGAVEVTSADVDIPAEYQTCCDELTMTTRAQWEDHCRSWTEIIKRNIKACQNLTKLAMKLQGNIGSTQFSYRSAKMRAQKVHGARVRLNAGKHHLFGLANKLVERLAHFRTLDEICEHLPSNSSKVNRHEIIALLRQFDRCTSFVISQAGDTWNATYQLKSKHLRSRLLSAIKFHLSATMRETMLQNEAVQQMPCSTHDLNIVKDECFIDDASKLSSIHCAAFRSAITCLRPMMDWIESHSKRYDDDLCEERDYERALQDCHMLYFQQRVNVVVVAASKHLQVLSSAQHIRAFVRSGFTYMLQVLRAEIISFTCLFLMPDEDTCFRILLEPLMSIFRDLIRPRYISLNDIFVIAELIEVCEEISDELKRVGREGNMLYPFVQNLIADVQERLIFRAETFIQDEVEHYQLSRDDFTFFIQESQIQGNISHDDHEWFPPLKNTLSCLATLYRCLDSYTFSSLAAEVVQVCMESIVRASRSDRIGLRDTDACLFTIKNLLILREQISPFESDLMEHPVPMRDLDLAQIHGEVHRIFSGEANIFASSSGQNYFPVPRVIKSNLDSRKQLDQCVKVACEAYIMFVTREIVDPMLAFLTKVTALRASDSLSLDTPISTLAFATPERLAEIVLQVNGALTHKLPQLIRQMTLYIDSTVSRDMILNAIKSNVVEAHSQFAGFVIGQYGDNTPSKIDLKLPSELAKLLDVS